MKVPAVLKNKYLFYALAVLAALNVVGYASVKAYECLALFLLAGYGMHCYCKNKSLAILAALFVANFVFGCGRVKEGFEEAMKAPEDLLKDAADAASKAGDQLMKEGNEPAADVCAALSITAQTQATDCTGINKADGTNAGCQFTAAKKADHCYDAQGNHVPKINNEDANAQNCVSPNMWNATATDARCEMPSQ